MNTAKLSERIVVVAFDADDTLWVNEPYFQEAERKFCELLEDYLPQHSVSRALLEVELSNLQPYGYGVKSFMLSMIEAAIGISNGSIGLEAIEKIIAFGKELLDHPIELIAGIEGVLDQLQGQYRLVMATKGDLLDQERKLIKSGLGDCFHHIEIVSDKTEKEYRRLIRHLDVAPDEFLMIGNSLKSDILPVLEVGGYAVHVPYHTTWEHERVEKHIEHERFRGIEKIEELLALL